MTELILRRRLQIVPSTFNREARTVEAVLSSGAGVQRRDARGVFTERLAVTAGAVTLHTPRLPVLDSHRQGSIGDVLGFVSNVRAEGGEIRATLHITSDAALALVEAGALTGVSIGYRVAPSDWTESDGGRVRTASRWTLLEVSLVPVPADPGAILRSHEMPDTNIPDTTPANRAEVNGQIRALSTRHNLGATWADAQIDAGADLAAARDAALAELDRRAEAAPRIRAHQTGESNDDPEVIRTRMSDALTHRAGALAELPEAAAQYRGLGFAGMARVMLAARGERVLSLSDEAVLTRAMGTGDLPNLLQSTGHRTLLAAYENARSPVLQFFRRTEGSDFRTMYKLRFGEMALLDKVNEHGEVTSGGIGESAESYRIETYAKMFALTRQAIVNDDLGAFSQMTMMQGRQAAETLNNAAVSFLTQGSGLGPVMSDGQRMFDSSHGNVAAAGAVPGESAFAEGLAAMRGQRGIDGVSPINVTPRYLLVSPEFEVDASHAIAEIFPTSAENVNSVGRGLTLMVEPRLSGQRWYLFADPASVANFEVAYLASAPAPQMEARPGWDVLGVEFRTVFDFGVGAIDWRGGFTNEGDTGILGGEL